MTDKEIELLDRFLALVHAAREFGGADAYDMHLQIFKDPCGGDAAEKMVHKLGLAVYSRGAKGTPGNG